MPINLELVDDITAEEESDSEPDTTDDEEDYDDIQDFLEASDLILVGNKKEIKKTNNINKEFLQELKVSTIRIIY